MQKWKIIVLLFACGLRLCALDNGAVAPMLNDLSYLHGRAFGLEPDKVERKKYPQKLYIVAFWGSWSPSSRQALGSLRYLKRTYGTAKGLDIVAISREDPKEIRRYLETRNDINFAVAHDKGSNLTFLYLGADYMRLPQMFIVNKYREVIWQGEDLDLEDKLKQIYDGTFDKDKEKRVSKMQKSLNGYLQRRDYPNCLVLVDKILKLDPGNAVALRTGLFIYENSKRYDQAFVFVDRVIAMAPERSRSYFVKLGLLYRAQRDITQVRKLSATIIKKFAAQRAVMNNLAWTLMQRFEFNGELVDLTRKAAVLAVKDIDREPDIYKKASFLNTYARSCYVIGKNQAALKAQEKVSKILKDSYRRQASERLCEYYRKIIAENKKK